MIEKGIFAQLAPGAVSLEELYQVPNGYQFEGRVIVTNRGAQTSFRVSLAPDGAVDDNKQYVAYDKIIAANDTGVTVKFKLQSLGKIRVYAGSANLSFAASGDKEFYSG